jgi:hypothetical protein
MLTTALAGPMQGVDEIVFVTRSPGKDGHWYANFGYWSSEPQRAMYATDGSRLCKLNVRTGQVAVLLADASGSFRDPVVHYDARKILFSYRKGGTAHFNLYEINVDGSALKRITTGAFDDIEPCYLPDGDIVFCSSRCNRWVGCWHTPVATLHRASADGSNIRVISSNLDHDNTPAVLNDGRILYTRWEYIDRSQIAYHHLWSFNPDGTGQMTWFGNMHSGTVMIDAKPIPDSNKVAAIFSPGHGANEHRGRLHIISPDAGPDARGAAVAVRNAPDDSRDPYPFSERCILVAAGHRLVLVDPKAGDSQTLHQDEQMVHEPYPIRQRTREPVIPDRTDSRRATGRMVLSNVTIGRNMDGVSSGEIRKLLILEPLPKPVNFSGGPEPLTMGGSFNLERVLGTVPVEADGSAYFELPAHRPVFFVALDERDMSVKRMQSFTSVMPGETAGCVGCHEQRTRTTTPAGHLLALRRPPSRIAPFEGFPSVIDFPRDVQPVLDRHCVSCHDYDSHQINGQTVGPRSGGVVLTGDRGPTYSHSYWTLFARKQIADGRNGTGNRAPRTLGSSASPLLQKIDRHHQGVKLSEPERRMVWLWIESGATYPGTYAALGSGMVGTPIFQRTEQMPQVTPVLQNRCGQCHTFAGAPKVNAQRIGFGHGPVLFNLSRPNKSWLLLAPLSKEAGGHGRCGIITPGAATRPADVFASSEDPDYRTLLGAIEWSATQLNRIKRFDMPDFWPNEHYLREMRRYGILASGPARSSQLNAYELDELYWRSMWWRPQESMATQNPSGQASLAGQ